MDKNLGKNISENLSGKYSKKLLDHAKQSATDALTTASKRAILKSAEATGDLIDNKIADKTMKVSITSLYSSSEKVENETKNAGFDKEIPKRRYISSEKRQKISDDLRLI